MEYRAVLLPDFLCIGAAKTGTNWLAHNLNAMDEVFVPPFHELRYFNSYEMGRTEIQRSIYERCISASRVISGYLDKKNVNPNLFKWYANWAFTNTLDDEWYSRLFLAGKGKIKGDITPSYHWLSESSVKKISELLPDVKIVFIMRYPADTVWSYYQMNKQLPENLRAQALIDNGCDFEQSLESGFFDENTLYVSSINKWRKYFSADQMYFCFYDDMKANRERYLTDIARYVGVKHVTINPEVFNVMINTSASNTHGLKDPISNANKAKIAKRYYNSVVDLANIIGGSVVESWIEKMSNDLCL